MTTIHPLSQVHPEAFDAEHERQRAQEQVRLTENRAAAAAYSIMMNMRAEERAAPDETERDYFDQCQMAVDVAREEWTAAIKRSKRVSKEWRQFLKDTGKA